jgi:hypothetical protein
VSPPAAAVAELATLVGVDFDIAEYSYGTGTAQLDLAKEFVPKATITDTPLRDRLLLNNALAAHRADATMSQAAAMKVILEQFSKPSLSAYRRATSGGAGASTHGSAISSIRVVWSGASTIGSRSS